MTPELSRPGPSRAPGPHPAAAPRARRDRPAQALLEALEAVGPRPALAWHGEPGRVELSGHVLANWIVKTVNHLDQELLLNPGDLVVLDLAPHWKRLVIAVAAWSLGARVLLPEELEEGEQPRVLVTADAGSALAARADEVLVLEPVSLAMSFPGPLPALAHDWVQEVRGCADRLAVVLPAWSGPAPAPADPPPAGGPDQRALPAPLVLASDGVEEASRTLGALLSGRGVVGPAAALPSAPAGASAPAAGRPGPVAPGRSRS